MKKTTLYCLALFVAAFLAIIIYRYNSTQNYEVFLGRDVIGIRYSDLTQRFGNPSTRNKLRDTDVMNVGPTVKSLKSQKGDLIGVSVVIDSKGFVVRCDGIYKD